MSATFTTPKTPLEKQAEGLDILSQFLSLNKDSVMAAGEETRRQMQLTADEKKKLDEARAFLAKHAELDADLKKREQALATGQAAHTNSINEHAAFVASENTRLEGFAAALTAKENQLNESAKRNADEAKTLNELRGTYERQHREAISSCQRAEAANTQAQIANTQVKAVNDKEAQRLKDWEANLKTKAQKIREQMASF